MEFSCMGFDQPPYFWKLWNWWGTISFGHKNGKTKLQKNTQMAIFNIHILGKVPKSTQNP